MPLPKTGKRSEKQRQTLNRYQKEKYVVCAAKLKKEDAESFRVACAASGTTPNAIFTACALDYIAAHAAPDQQQTPPPKTD